MGWGHFDSIFLETSSNKKYYFFNGWWLLLCQKEQGSALRAHFVIVDMQCSVTSGVLNWKVSLTWAMATVHLHCSKPTMVRMLMWLRCFT